MTEQPNREVAVLNAALELRPAERSVYLDQACAGDDALRRQVEALLDAHEQAEGFLVAPPAGLDFKRTLLVNIPLTEKPGDKIGRYKLLQQIGEGGCGVVYMAEQEEPVRRRVALKVIKLGMDTKQVIARFEAERQALALMDHPNIAKVLDAGATEKGRPYFVMELVRGIKITDFCDETKLSTQDRLKLFILVCQAIQHAHQKGVIHRDIKPSNILITVNDGVPVPKVIDFGIAKAAQGRLTDQTLFTAFEQFIGTPAYMSPEQAVMTSLDIDTRSDIYSLGVLLYELLTGRTPFDQKELLAAGLDEMRRTIREKEPPRPSTVVERLSKLRVERGEAPAPQGSSALNSLSTDLDWIVMKCLEKDRARRYETANGLVMDILRHLNCEPVVARPPSRLYEFQKTFRRHKFGFAAAGAVAAALILGLATTMSQYFKERTARQRATAVSGLLQQLLSSADPEGLRGPDYTVRQLLDDFSSVLTNRPQLAAQPEVEATVRLAIGWAYYKRGALFEAERNLRQAVELRRRALGPEHPDTLEAKDALASLLAGGERKWEEAGKLSFETWQAWRRRFGAEHTNSLKAEHTYAMALMEGGRAQEAEPIERQVLQIRKRVLPPDDNDTIQSLGTLGQILMYRGAYADAEGYLRQAMAAFQRTGYADKQDGIICAKEIALCRMQQGDPAEAVKGLEIISLQAITNLGSDHVITLQVQRALARALAEDGQLQKAEALCKLTLDMRRHSTAKQEGYGTARTQLTLGRVLVEEGKLDEAQPPLEEALKFFREDPVSQPRPELAAQAANWLGVIQLGRTNYVAAETNLLAGCEQFFLPTADMTPNERLLAVGHIVRLYQAWGKPEQLVVWQKKLAELDKVRK